MSHPEGGEEGGKEGGRKEDGSLAEREMTRRQEEKPESDSGTVSSSNRPLLLPFICSPQYLCICWGLQQESHLPVSDVKFLQPLKAFVRSHHPEVFPSSW